MVSHLLPAIHISPPIASVSNSFDRTLFQKSIPVLAVRVNPPKAGLFLKSQIMKESLLQIPKVKSVVSEKGKPEERLVLLSTAEEDALSPDVRDFVAREGMGLVPYTVVLDYSYWTADQILEAVLPQGLPEGTPTSFSISGHIAHVNLREEYLPYKHMIGQVILDKNTNIRTVVNKLDNINSQFRYFQMELIAGDPDFLVEVNESNCRFVFDFTKVYWNSRLHHEHERLVSTFKQGEVIADVFAGVGPFALPAARRGCVVFANDLNPESAKWMKQNVERNNVQDRVRVSCEDGMSFIKSVVTQVWDDPFPDLGPVKSANQKARESRQRRQVGSGESFRRSGTRRVAHFVMNLPDSAISFLGAFKNLFSELHLQELEQKFAEEEILQRVKTSLGNPASLSVEMMHLVRRVAPNKDMYCISFRLPRDVSV